MELEGPAFITYLEHRRLIMDYMNMSALALLVYDYILTLHLEIKCIWLSKWSYTKVLFFVTRYVVFAQVLNTLQGETLLDLPIVGCKITWALKPLLVFTGIFLAEAILCIRTWAVWNRNKVVGVVLIAAMLANFAVQAFVQTKFISSLHFAPSPYAGFKGCLATRISRVFWGDFLSHFVVQLVVFTLVVISAFRLYKQGRYTELMLVIHRDGILFYVYLFFWTGANMYMAIAAPLDLSNLFIPLEGVLYSLLTTRILFNIRSVGNQNEFHTSYFDMKPRITPLQFVSTDVQDRTIGGGT